MGIFAMACRECPREAGPGHAMAKMAVPPAFQAIAP